MTDGNPALETLTGIIERVTFHNPDNGFAVLKVAARGHRDLATLLGHLPRAVAGVHFLPCRQDRNPGFRTGFDVTVLRSRARSPGENRVFDPENAPESLNDCQVLQKCAELCMRRRAPGPPELDFGPTATSSRHAPRRWPLSP